MPIDLLCASCGKTLRVPDDAAGKKAKCPACQYVFPVPSTDHFNGVDTSQRRWQVRLEDGRTYGPVTKSELDQWVREGRITPRTELAEEGNESWILAIDIYPVLSRGHDMSAADASAAADINPAFPPRPAQSPASLRRSRAGVEPHRGGAILTLGILSLCCNVCLIPGICAMVMGNHDLAAMRAGRMDASGQALTQTGWILGIIGTALTGFGALVNVLALVAG